ELADPVSSHQDRRMAVEVACGEERRPRILDESLLVRLRGYPQDDHVVVAFAGLRIEGVRPWVAEEDERLPAHLVHRLAAASVLNSDMWHAGGQLVHVFEPGLPRARRHVPA